MQPLARRHHARLLLALIVVIAIVAPNPPTAIASDTSTRWEYFSESSGCGSAYTRPPFADRRGWLPDSQIVAGPFGTYFGRTIGAIRSEQVLWTVPFSGGRQVKVHRAALPAFRQVRQNLIEQAAQGRIYQVHAVGSFNPRTVSGEYQISRHAFGTAIDINPAQNPYRRNGPLITNMPTWYVNAWKSAGFCWGGDWRGEKDAMHFSWIGPGTGFGSDLPPQAPRTQLRSFGPVDRTFSTVIGPVMSRYTVAIGAVTANDGPNFAGIRAHPGGAVLDVATGYGSFGECSVDRWFLEDGSMAGDDRLLLMDIDGDSRQDLVTLRQSGASTEVQIAAYQDDYQDSVSFGRNLGDVVAAAGADFDADRIADLWVVTGDGVLSIYRGPAFQTVIVSHQLPSGAPDEISAADRDGGNRPELFALYGRGGGARIEVLRFSSGWTVDQSFAAGAGTGAIGAMDYDGDGRADLLSVDSSGRLSAMVGNTSTGASTTRWFVELDRDCSNPILLDFEGTFYDDEGNVHVNGIEWISAEGITAGCNPPFNDAFCPEDELTRAQAAAFIVRALDLPATSQDFYLDDNGTTLEESINRLAAAGITRGCNPPRNDRYCPTRDLSRGEFATFLDRVKGLPATGTDFFVDDRGHTHEAAINRIAESGITRGCNPPANTEFCPDRTLTRAETATFFTRAFRD